MRTGWLHLAEAISNVLGGFSAKDTLGCVEMSVLADEASNVSTLTLDLPKVLALLHEHIETTRVHVSHTTLCLKDKGVPRGAGRTCELLGPARRICNQIQMDTISLNTVSN